MIVLDKDGNAEGDLFYDDGESMDTIENNAYFYATYDWSSQRRQLKVNVVKNKYAQMTKLILNSLTIYGLDELPSNIEVDGQQISATQRSQTRHVDVTGFQLSMSRSHTFTWSNNHQNEYQMS